jgi:WD40 repeat protein
MSTLDLPDPSRPAPRGRTRAARSARRIGRLAAAGGLALVLGAAGCGSPTSSGTDSPGASPSASGPVAGTLTGHGSSVLSVAFSPDGKTLATGSVDNTARLWDVGTRAAKTTLTGAEDVRSLAFSPDGKTLATVYNNPGMVAVSQPVQLWDLATGQVARSFAARSLTLRLRPNNVAFSPDGATLATASSMDVQLWNAATGQQTGGTKDGGTGCGLAFSPDGKLLAVGRAQGEIQLLDAAIGQVTATLTGHTKTVWSVAFSPDGKTLASGSEDGTIRLWSVASGQSTATLTGHTQNVNSVAFSPDGRTVASGGYDKTVRLWSVANGQSTATFTGHEGKVWSVAFSPDGKLLASVGDDPVVRLWNVPSS